jgi:hypothetical protein
MIPADAVYGPIVLLNLSARVTDEDAQRIAHACDVQMEQDIAPAHGIVPRPVVFAKSARPGDTVVALVDTTDPNATDALAYHTEEGDGSIYAPVFVGIILGQTGATVLRDVSAAASHEIAELALDYAVNRWADAFDGYEYAYEIADPVEGDLYPVQLEDGTRVMVSNFVYPAWFDEGPAAGSRFDHMGTVAGPFTLAAGGYAVRRQPGGAPSQVFGDAHVMGARPRRRIGVRLGQMLTPDDAIALLGTWTKRLLIAAACVLLWLCGWLAHDMADAPPPAVPHRFDIPNRYIPPAPAPAFLDQRGSVPC